MKNPHMSSRGPQVAVSVALKGRMCKCTWSLHSKASMLSGSIAKLCIPHEVSTLKSLVKDTPVDTGYASVWVKLKGGPKVRQLYVGERPKAEYIFCPYITVGNPHIGIAVFQRAG